MSLKHQVQHHLVAQFHDPHGAAGHVVGWVMARRASNVRRSRWAVDLLDIQPTDQVLELGCGPGVAVAAAAAKAHCGLVVGVDRSAVMVGQATRRNAAAVRDGTVMIVHASVADDRAFEGGLFDAALAVNTVGFWPEPAARLAALRRVMRPGGRIALVSQPRCPGATAEHSARAADGLVALVDEAGFGDTRVETLPLDPPAVCVLAIAPAG